MDKFWKWLKQRGVFLIAVAVIYGLAAVIFIWLYASDWLAYTYTDEAGKTVSINLWPWSWLMLVCVYTGFSFDYTRLSERAIKFFLRIPLYEIPHGKLSFVPLGFCWLVKVPVEIQQIELPGEPEQIWRLKDAKDEELPLGIGQKGEKIDPPKKASKELQWVHPIRIPFDDQNPKPENDPLQEISEFLGRDPQFRKTLGTTKGKGREEEDPFNKRVITEVSGMLRFRVWNLPNFLRSWGEDEPEKAFPNALQQLSDIAVSQMTAALQIGTLGRALLNQDLLGHYITKKIRERVEHVVKRVKKDAQDKPVKDANGSLVYESVKRVKKDAQDKPVKDANGSLVYEEITEGHPKGDTVSCRRGVEIVSFQLKPPIISHNLAKDVQKILQEKAKAAALAQQAGGEQRRMELLNEWAQKPGGHMMLELERLRTIQESIGKPGDKVVLVDSQNPIANIFGAVAAGKAILQTPAAPSRPPPTLPTTP